MPRARSRSMRADARQAAGAGAPSSLQRRQVADGLDVGAAQALLGLRPLPGSRRTASGARKAASRPGRDDDEAARLARVARHLGDDLATAATPREHVRLVPARTAVCTASATTRAREEVWGHLTDVEVTLVEARSARSWGRLRAPSPDAARVLAVERNAVAGRRRPAGSGAAPRHALMAEWMPKPPRDVVRSRDDAAPPGVAADHERLRAELRGLELLDGRVERVEVQVRDDHANKCTGRR